MGAFVFIDASIGGFGVTGFTFQNNTIVGGSDAASKHGIGVWVWKGPSSNITIKNNTIHDLYGWGIDVTTGISGTGAISGTNLIEGNTIYNVGYGWTQSYGGIGIGSDVLVTRPFSGMTIRYNNVSYVGASGILAWPSTSTQIYYNVIYHTGQWATGSEYPSGISELDGNVGLNIYNNAIYYSDSLSATGYGMGIQINTANQVTLKNNIICGAKTWLIWAKVAYTGNNNLFYPLASENYRYVSTNYTFADYKTASGQEANSLNSNPLMIDPANGNFRLQSGSPAINAGVDVGLTQDYEGKLVPRGSAPDIGAYEYMGSGRPWVYKKGMIDGGMINSGMIQ